MINLFSRASKELTFNSEVSYQYLLNPALVAINEYFIKILPPGTETYVEPKNTSGAVVTAIHNIGFGAEILELPLGDRKSPILVPTLTNINLGNMTGRGHGSSLLSIWESYFSISDFPYLAVSNLDKPRYFMSHGYIIPYGQKALLKQRR